MLKNRIHLKNKMHILLIISFISIAVISFFFMTNKTYATETTDWSLPGYNGDFEADSNVNADEPKNKYRIGIDDIVYNRVPLFDVNVFSDKPGGQPIDTTSPLYFLRSIVANWFVLGMNLSLVAMIIIIMYTGIRMALTTIAEKKAEYKEMLFNFVKAIAKMFLLAAIMALVMNICQYLTGLFAENGPKIESSIGGRNLYVTMATRALGSISFNSKIPAAILFFGLSLTFFKFCYRYTKRLLNVYLLIIVAPVLVAKDAYEGASGKQGKTFSAWLQEFTLNVALQPAHALIYSALVFVALDNGTDNVMNFLIAVLIMNFMVSADKIFFKIFNMRFTKGPGAAGAADALTEGVKMYAGIQAAKEGAKLYGKTVKGTAEFAKRTGRVVGGTVKNVSNKLGSMNNDVGKKVRAKKTRDSIKKANKEKEDRLDEDKPNGFLETLDRIAGKKNKAKRNLNKAIAGHQIRSAENAEEGRGIAGHMPEGIRNYIADARMDRAQKALRKTMKKNGGDKSFLSQMSELRKLSKRNDETGRITRKLLKMKKEHEIKKFKYVAGSIIGVAGQTLAIFAAPALVSADESDMALAAVTATMGNTSTAIAKHYYYRRNARDELLTRRSFEDTLESLKNANADLGTLQAKFDAIEEHDRESRRDTYEKMLAYSELKLDEHTLRSMLNAYIMKQGQQVFDESRLDDMIDTVLRESGVEDLGLDSPKINEIKRSVKAEIMNSQTNNRVRLGFAAELNAGVEEETGHRNRFSEAEVISLARKAVEGEDISELTDRQIIRMLDGAMQGIDIEGGRETAKKAHQAILGIAKEQRENKFTKGIEALVAEEMARKQAAEAAKKEQDSEYEIEELLSDDEFEDLGSRVEKTAKNLIEMLAVEDIKEKEKYVQMALDEIDSTALTEEQREEIKERVDVQVEQAINENAKNKDKERVDVHAAADAFTDSIVEDKLMDKELDKLGDSEVLSKEVREAIDRIKRDVKHEKTKKGSIGTIVDLERSLRHMRDIP